MKIVLSKIFLIMPLLVLASIGKSAAVTVGDAKAAITLLEKRITGLDQTIEENINKINLVITNNTIFKDANNTADHNEIHGKCKIAIKAVASSIHADEYDKLESNYKNIK